MQLRVGYPNDTVVGACFLTGDYQTDEGIIDLDMFLEDMPPSGRLCLSPKAVRMLVTCLGHEWPSDDMTRDFNELSGLYLREHEENLALRKAVAAILNARNMSRIEDWMVDS